LSGGRTEPFEASGRTLLTLQEKPPLPARRKSVSKEKGVGKRKELFQVRRKQKRKNQVICGVEEKQGEGIKTFRNVRQGELLK